MCDSVILTKIIVLTFVLQCLFMFAWGVDTVPARTSHDEKPVSGHDEKPVDTVPARTSHDEKPASAHDEKPVNAPSPIKNSTAQSAPSQNGGEAVNQTSSLFPNDTISFGYKPNDGKLNPGAVLRGFYVFVGLGAIVIMYIIVRTIRLRRKKTTVRKYGILASREDVEMTPLGAEDDDEDTTLFDMNNHSRP